MADFSSGAVVDDDLDFSAAQGRSKTREAARRQDRRVGRPRAEHCHRRVGRRGGGRPRALGDAAFRRHGSDRYAQPELVGPLYHVLYVLRGSVCRRPHHLVGAQGLRHRRVRRHLQGGGDEFHRLHCGRHRHGGGRSGPAYAPVGAVRVLQPGQPAHVGHPGAGHLSHLVLRVPVGAGARRGGQDEPIRPCASSRWWPWCARCSCTR